MQPDLRRLQELLKAPRRKNEPGLAQGTAPDGFTREVVSEGEVFVSKEEISVDGAYWPPQLDLSPLIPPQGAKRDELVFLDTETTGLGGSGVYSFMVGVGRFNADRLTLTQFLLPSPAQEHAFLSRLQDACSQGAVLVTYNGRAFDWPHLSDRFIMNAMSLPTWRFHLDLLFWVRRLLGPMVSDCRLGSIEREVLGKMRPEGISGRQVPAVYFDYLRTGNTVLLNEVARRNRVDILSLVELTGHIAAYWRGLLPQRLGGSILLGLGQICEERGQLERALIHYETASERAQNRRQCAEAMKRLAFIYKRKGNAQKARHWFSRAWQQAPHDPTAAVELAKYYEHQDKDYDLARQWVLQALAAVGHPNRRKWQHDLLHRLARLDRKREEGCGSHSVCSV